MLGSAAPGEVAGAGTADAVVEVAVEGAQSVQSPVTRLARLRLAAGFSQAELARLTGLSRTTYWRLETGRLPNPPVRFLTNCALALSVDFEAVLEPEWTQWTVFDAQHAAQPPARAAPGR